MARVALPLLLLAASTAAQTPERRQLTVEPGRTLGYRVTLPAQFDAKASWPLLLVEDTLEPPPLPGWIVVQPERTDQAPSLFDNEAWSKRFLRQLRIDFRIQRNRIHLLGSARSLQVAAWQPQEFRSVLVAQSSGTAMGLEPKLRAVGLTVARSGDVPIADALALWQNAPPLPEPQRAIDLALDDFHDAAAKGDADRYFPRFAPEGVFLGTDRSERWTLEAFRAFGLPHFKTGSAWIFVPQVRHIDVAPGGEFAWFDEELGSASYGFCRGSGALRRIAGEWRITQYNLTIPIPNDLAKEFVGRIREFESKPDTAASRPGR